MEIKSKYMTPEGELIVEKESLSVSPFSQSLSTSPLPNSLSNSLHSESLLSKKISMQNFKLN